jgi:hypothetical protein
VDDAGDGDKRVSAIGRFSRGLLCREPLSPLRTATNGFLQRLAIGRGLEPDTAALQSAFWWLAPFVSAFCLALGRLRCHQIPTTARERWISRSGIRLTIRFLGNDLEGVWLGVGGAMAAVSLVCVAFSAACPLSGAIHRHP